MSKTPNYTREAIDRYNEKRDKVIITFLKEQKIKKKLEAIKKKQGISINEFCQNAIIKAVENSGVEILPEPEETTPKPPQSEEKPKLTDEEYLKQIEQAIQRNAEILEEERSRRKTIKQLPDEE